MLPTLSIPSVAPPPQRGSEPASGPAAESEGGDAFADALQRAQREPKTTRTNEPRSQASKAADAQARAARHAQAKSPASEAAQQPADETARGDAAACAITTESAAGDGAPSAPMTAEEPPASLAPPIAIDATVMPRAAIETIHGERPRAADAEETALSIDDRAALNRAGSRINDTRDLRAGPSLPSRVAPQNEPVGELDAPATALALHTALEHAAADAAATPAINQRAPAFDRQAIEPSASPLAAALLARDMNSAPVAPGAESKLPQATLHAAIDEPGFGAALGTQVSVWVRDGVQEARLQLHPAELGPVTVQIALDGQAAHVDFTAAVAATRESIEQSLPALAAALRESGFTLAGGGVSSHAGQSSGDPRRDRAGAGGHGN
ncbi:MAG TPA: flagellar hook-length control protein FliK, partial [Burkholderiaceae bacterium]